MLGFLAWTLWAGLTVTAHGAEAGDLDRSFAGDGRKLTDVFNRRDRAVDVAVQPDGKILVAGTSRKNDVGDRMTATRYERDGSLDRGFGDQGFAFLRRGAFRESGGAALALQPNGKILVAGDAASDLTVARFRRTGEIDRSFGNRGRVTTNLFGLNRAEDIALQPNGQIVVAGHTRAASGGNDQLVLARYTRDGRPDESFSEDGWLLTTFGADTYALAYGVALQDDGKIVVSGELGNSFIVARFESGGALDTSFGNFGGYQALDPIGAGNARELAIQADGAIMVGGSDCDEPSCSFALARFLPDGSPDSGFGDGGLVRTWFGGDDTSESAMALAVQPDGHLVLAGNTARTFSASRFAVARYTPAGEPDPIFSEDGKTSISFRQGSSRRHRDFAHATAITQRGRIVVAGLSGSVVPSGNEDFALARFLGEPSG